MRKKLKDVVEYKEKIIEVPLAKIEANQLNPRKRFVDSEEDNLIDSILAKGLLNPIIVYKRRKDNKYVILDGERRYRAYKKLNYTQISCHVLEKEPNNLENLSMMFHLHNVREEWTDFAIAQTLIKVITEMGKVIKVLTGKDKQDISRLTSLSVYKINKYLIFYDYPQNVIDKFMKSEMQEEPDKGRDPDILAEMHGPIKRIRKVIPEFFKDYSVQKLIDACVKKKANKVIQTNREFRYLTKSLDATMKNKVRKKVMLDKLESFINDINITPKEIFEDTAETVYQLDDLIKKTDQLGKGILNINLNELTNAERDDLTIKLNNLVSIMKQKFDL